MEILFLILLLAVFGLFVSNAFLKERVSTLEDRLDALAGGLRYERAPVDEDRGPIAQPAVLREAEAAAMRTPATSFPTMPTPEPGEGETVEAEPDEIWPEQPRETLGGL